MNIVRKRHIEKVTVSVKTWKNFGRDRYMWKSVEEILGKGIGKFKVLEFNGGSCVAGAACLKKKVMENNIPFWIYPQWNINCLYIYLYHIFFIHLSVDI